MADRQESKYWMESHGERKRLASNHFIAKDELGGDLVLAPVNFSQPLKVLDSGTADGTWLLDLASSVPDPSSGRHEFFGTDLNPAPFPTSTPPNVSFAVQDIKNPWPESQLGHFDLVHQRLTLLGAGANPAASVRHLAAILKPGGWLQLCEATMEFPPEIVSDERTPAYSDMLRLMRSIAGAVGAEWHLGTVLKSYMEEAGFVNVVERDVVLRMGKANSDHDLAKQGVESCGIAVQGLSKFAKNLPPEKQPFPAERYETLTEDLERELAEKGSVFPLRIVYGQKPA